MSEIKPKVHVIDDKEYVEVDRKAQVGDYVWLVHAQSIDKIEQDYYNEYYRNGDWDIGEYRVLEPLESETTAPQSVDDVIANLVRRVTELERYVYEVTNPLSSEEIGEAIAEFDVVHRPRHYNSGKYEVIDIIEDITQTAAKGGASGSECYALGNALKYLARYRYKNGKQDVEKAKWYIERIIAELEKEGDAIE